MKRHETNAAHASPGEESGKLATAAKVFRAATAIVVFGIPLLVGTVAVVGYGAHEVYKRLRGDRSS